MNLRILLAAAALAALPAQAALQVTFVDPERYTDAGNERWETDANLKTLERHIQRLGERYVTHGEAVRIEILDLDLAGWARWGGSGANKVRVARGGADFPMIRLRYNIDGNGPSRSAEVTLSDPLYLNRARTRASDEPLYYEKRLLENWFRSTFVEAAR